LNLHTLFYTAEKQNLEKTLGISGTITSINSKTLSSQTTEELITEINAEVGDLVKKGDVIVTLNSDEIKKKLEAAKVALENANKKKNLELEGAKRNFNNTEITRSIELERSSKVVSEAYQNYANAVSKKASTEADYQKALKNRKEIETTYYALKNKVTSVASEVETKKRSLDHAQAEYDAALLKYEEATTNASTTNEQLTELKRVKDETYTTLSQVKEAYTTLSASFSSINSEKEQKELEYNQYKLEETNKETEYKSAVALIETTTKDYQKAVENGEDLIRSSEKSLQEQKDNYTTTILNTQSDILTQEELAVQKYEEAVAACTIIAPFDGVITSINVAKGDRYKGGDLFTIQDISSFEVSALVSQYDISDIQKGMKATIKTDTTEQTEMSGNVTFVSPIPKTSSGSNSSSTDYEIRIAILDASERLRIGMSAKTTIILNQVKETFVVPYYCIEESEDLEPYITVLLQDGQQQRIPVTKTLETDFNIAITGDGLTEGMQILVPQMDESITQ
jgi:HlyD family secretion protein